MDELLKNTEGSLALPPDASELERFKYELCKQIIIYLQENRITQKDLAKKLEVSEPRISEIVHYKIDKFSADLLISYNESLNSSFKLQVS